MSSCARNVVTGELACPVCAPVPPCPVGLVCPYACRPVVAHSVPVDAGWMLALMVFLLAMLAVLVMRTRDGIKEDREQPCKWAITYAIESRGFAPGDWIVVNGKRRFVTSVNKDIITSISVSRWRAFFIRLRMRCSL